MGRKKVTRKAVSKQSPEQERAARINQLREELREVKDKGRELQAELNGGTNGSLEDFAWWACRYAAPLLRSTATLLDRFDNGSVGDIEEHREEIAHAVAFALAACGDEMKERARTAVCLI